MICPARAISTRKAIAMKRQFSVEALYAFVFAICVLLALVLLTACGQAGGY